LIFKQGFLFLQGTSTARMCEWIVKTERPSAKAGGDRGRKVPGAGCWLLGTVPTLRSGSPWNLPRSAGAQLSSFDFLTFDFGLNSFFTTEENRR
jgi:hypothetical protein